MPKAPDCGCFSRPGNPRISRYRAFPENPVTQGAEPESSFTPIIAFTGAFRAGASGDAWRALAAMWPGAVFSIDTVSCARAGALTSLLQVASHPEVMHILARAPPGGPIIGALLSTPYGCRGACTIEWWALPPVARRGVLGTTGAWAGDSGDGPGGPR